METDSNTNSQTLSSNDGTQINYSEFLDYKDTYNDNRSLNFTSSEYFETKKAEQQHEMYNSLFYGGSGLMAAKFAYDYTNNNSNLLAKINNLPSSNILNQRLEEASDISPINNLFRPPADKSSQRLSNAIQSNLLVAEEASPLQILKTLQLSSFSTLFVEVADFENRRKVIGSSSIKAYKDYYKNLILNNSGITISDRDIKNGFILEDNKLYQRLGTGDKGQELLGFAKVVNTNLRVGDQNSPNRIFQKFANIHGVNTRLENYADEPLAIVGAKTKLKAQVGWMDAYSRFASEIGFKVLDNPLSFLEEYSSAIGLKDARVFQSNIFQTSKKIVDNFSLGTNGVYDQSLGKSFTLMAKNIGIKSAVAYGGYTGLNSLLEDITPKSSIWNEGVLPGLASSYASLRVGFAKLWSDKFQGFKERQEEAAPESTSLLALMGLPLAGAMTGANAAYFQRLYDTKKLGIEPAIQKHTLERSFGGTTGELLDKLNLNGPGTTLKRYSKLGALVAGTLALPYLPGALIGDSSEELAKEYSGEKEVAVRANRFWLMGGDAYEGGKIKYHRKSLVAETIANAKDKSIYENSEEKRRMNPIYSPFRYLKNPYAFEEAHIADRPYPVWGMDVTYGSFMGQLFQGTVGQIIKPDVVNPGLSHLVTGKGTAVKEGLKLIGADSVDEEGSLSVEAQNFEGGQTNPGSYVVPVHEDKDTKSLVNDGLMMAQPSPSNHTLQRSLTGAYTAGSDFIGMKGFAGNMLARSMNLDPEAQLEPQLAVSGSSQTVRKSILDSQLGDIGGAGEFIRRLVPQSVATDMDTINPMQNSVSPEWLPSNETKYYKNFKRGDYFNETTEHGETLLPSRGYAELSPELKGINPNDYPLVYQYKILQNIARGSAEHIATRNYLTENIEAMTEKEQQIFFEGYEQEKAREKEKTFYEYKDSKDKATFGILQTAQNALWESFSHVESPLEPLTPFRPASKFLHQRTAIEDYQRTQLAGSDAAIWTKPIDHFIRPSAHRLTQITDAVYKPKEAKEQENIDEYFDKLALLKYSKNGDEYKAQRTVAALSVTGIHDAKTMRQFQNALPDHQKPYVESFAKEEDTAKRKKIIEMLPTDIGLAYQSIWSNIDLTNAAKAKGVDAKEYLKSNYIKESNVLGKNKGVTVSSDVREAIKNRAEGLSSNTERKQYIQMEEAKAIRMQVARQDAQEYIENQTGKVPGDDWIGWDPRLTVEDIKLKTLTVGKADLQRFGFWDKDIRRNDRIKVLDDKVDIINEYDTIKRESKKNSYRKHQAKVAMRKEGFDVSRIDYIPSNKPAVRIVDSSEYLRDFES